MTFLDDYEPVEDRLRKFWERYPKGQVVTELLDHADSTYIVAAALYRGDELRDGRPAATGLAREVETQRGVNATSALENCETSAIGRALANMGFAAKGKRPSREEMRKTAMNTVIASPAAVSVDTSAAPKAAASGTTEPPGPDVAVAGDDVGESGNSYGEGESPAPRPHAPVWVDAETIGGRKGWEVCSVPAEDGRPCWVHSARKARVPA